MHRVCAFILSNSVGAIAAVGSWHCSVVLFPSCDVWDGGTRPTSLVDGKRCDAPCCCRARARISVTVSISSSESQNESSRGTSSRHSSLVRSVLVTLTLDPASPTPVSPLLGRPNSPDGSTRRRGLVGATSVRWIFLGDAAATDAAEPSMRCSPDATSLEELFCNSSGNSPIGVAGRFRMRNGFPPDTPLGLPGSEVPSLLGIATCFEDSTWL
mmetsp:Transcript_17041/g.51542  ORF Transcript_17041/g.51542 Transcript_17041/m.51542 type:complete len:213 (-) Transcript_17041:467-1105(-)